MPTRSELQAEFLERIANFVLDIKCEGYRVKCQSYWRTMEEQEKLLLSGASKTLNSKHLIGLAMDLYLMSIDGAVIVPNLDLPETLYPYQIVSRHWTKNPDSVWGGNWQTWKDYLHFELNRGLL